MTNNTNHASHVTGININNIQENWTTHISHYILQRREQTYQAYTEQQMSSNQGADNDHQHSTFHPQAKDALFSVFMILLANQLEEGHTVLTLVEATNSPQITTEINGKTIKLYDWQQDLLQLLAAPLLDILANHEANTESYSLLQLLTQIETIKTQFWWQTTLNTTQRQQFIQRLTLLNNFYKQLNPSDDNPINLQTFMSMIEQYPLFANTLNLQQIESENSLSKNQKPIIYQIDPSYQKLTLWLHRTWQAEFNLANKIKQILKHNIQPLDITIADNLNEQQAQAINVANHNAFSIITGGPGTGKTYTVAQLVIALQQAQHNMHHSAEDNSEEPDISQSNIRFSSDSASLALAAPTGKAAQRMQESLQAALDAANVDMQLQDAKTIHRLLAIGRNGKPRYHADNPLGEDIIIVDEASMLGVELANYLVSAVKPGARLILLGDANQLAAVDAGAVLADLCRIPMLRPIHAELTESRRFSTDSGIGKLAKQINQQQVDFAEIWQLFANDAALKFESIQSQQTLVEEPIVQEYSAKQTTINTHEVDTNSSSNANPNFNLNGNVDNNLYLKNSLSNSSQNTNRNHTLNDILRQNYTNFINYSRELLHNPINPNHIEQTKVTISSLLTVFNKFRVLSAGHHGEWGDYYINNQLTQWHKAQLKLPLSLGAWYHGRPVMVLQNNYELGLFNGDIGICLQTAGKEGRLEVFFENKPRGIAVNLLNDELVATAYAMTIHKSQGSEFNHVAITLDKSHTRLLSKELIYTGVTRAKKQITVLSSMQALEKAIATPTQRHTGLALQF